MKRFRIIVLAFTIGVTSSCSVVNSNEVKGENKFMIKGNVEFPSSRFKTKASILDIQPNANVAISYFDISSNEVNGARNIHPDKVISSTLTDTSGNFSIESINFYPADNGIYLLEASKRLVGVGNPIIGLRTLLKWNGSSWTSITGTSIKLNSKTTALSRLVKDNQSLVNPIESIGKIDASVSPSVVSDVINPNDSNKKILATQVNNVATLVTSAITENRDPHISIKNNNGVYSIQRLDSGSIVSKNGCINCNLQGVDLSSIDLKGMDFTGADLSGQNLSSKDLSTVNLTNANLSNSDLSGVNLSTTTLSNTNFTDSYMTGVNLTNKDISSCNISYAFLNKSILKGATLPSTNLTNVDFSKAEWVDSTTITPHICADNSFGTCNL